MSELRKQDDPVKKVVIAGGGNIGLRLARALEKTSQVKLIERDLRRARKAAGKIDAVDMALCVARFGLKWNQLGVKLCR